MGRSKAAPAHSFTRKAEGGEVFSEARRSAEFEGLTDVALRSRILHEECAFCFFPISRVNIPNNGCNAVMVSGRVGFFQRVENQRGRPVRQWAEASLQNCSLPRSHEAYGRYG